MATGYIEPCRNLQQALAGKTSGAALEGASPRKQRKFLSASSSTHTCYFGTVSTERHQHTVVSLVEKHQDDKTGVSCPTRRGWQSEACTAWCSNGFGASLEARR